MARFIIQGGKALRGEVKVSGSKNAALPILAATLLTAEPCVIRNVPDIEDIHTMLAILRSLGSKVDFQNNTVRIETPRILHEKISHRLGCKMRASVLLLGPLLARTGYAKLPYPGGCVLGARPIDTHTDILRQLGVTKMPSKKPSAAKASEGEVAPFGRVNKVASPRLGLEKEIFFRGKPRGREVVLPEFSVTGTENALMAAALTPGSTTIRLAALEPHVQDLCRFLQKMGVKITGVGSHIIQISGKKKLRGIHYAITPDYLEAGTLVIASVLTRGNVVIRNIVPHDLDALWNLLCEMKVRFRLTKNSVKILPTRVFASCKRLQTNVFPGFPTDLQPPFVVLLTQAKGVSRIHETLFEGRFAYFPDLIKMGARIEKLNPHEALIKGSTQLRGKTVKSWDIRAGAAMILAALAAKGKTVINDIHYINRGYEHFDEKLRKLGVEITRLP